jgi:hypothetical protein
MKLLTTILLSIGLSARAGWSLSVTVQNISCTLTNRANLSGAAELGAAWGWNVYSTQVVELLLPPNSYCTVTLNGTAGDGPFYASSVWCNGVTGQNGSIFSVGTRDCAGTVLTNIAPPYVRTYTPTNTPALVHKAYPILARKHLPDGTWKQEIVGFKIK